MINGQRLAERIDASGLSYSEVARQTGLKQPTISRLVSGDQRNTSRLLQLARVVRTSPHYLVDETDDPEPGASPRMPAPPVTATMQVVFPPEEALAQMFEALLAGIDPAAAPAEQALLLAQRLPIGLSQLQGLRPGQIQPTGRRAPAAARADRAKPDRVPTS